MFMEVIFFKRIDVIVKVVYSFLMLDTQRLDDKNSKTYFNTLRLFGLVSSSTRWGGFFHRKGTWGCAAHKGGLLV